MDAFFDGNLLQVLDRGAHGIVPELVVILGDPGKVQVQLWRIRLLTGILSLAFRVFENEAAEDLPEVENRHGGKRYPWHCHPKSSRRAQCRS